MENERLNKSPTKVARVCCDRLHLAHSPCIISHSILCSLVIKYFWQGYFVPTAHCIWGQLPPLIPLVTPLLVSSVRAAGDLNLTVKGFVLQSPPRMAEHEHGGLTTTARGGGSTAWTSHQLEHWMLVACANETTLSHITRTTVTMKHRSLDGSKTTSHQLVETTPPDNNSTNPSSFLSLQSSRND